MDMGSYLLEKMLGIARLTILAEGPTCKMLREDLDPRCPALWMTENGSRHSCRCGGSSEFSVTEPTGSPSRPLLFNKHLFVEALNSPIRNHRISNLQTTAGGIFDQQVRCGVCQPRSSLAPFGHFGIDPAGKSSSRKLDATACRIRKHCHRCVHAGARKTLEAVGAPPIFHGPNGCTLHACDTDVGARSGPEVLL